MSTIIHISSENESSPNCKKLSFVKGFSSFIEKECGQHMQKIIHSIKVGIALVLVSLLYLLDPLFEQVGENAMWAIMTVVVVFEFFAGAAATYCRMMPNIKKKYDYGIMIFILTFNLVAVSGLRADKIIELARERLSTIGMGFAVCIFTSLLIFPMWASDELHRLTSSKFDKLACCIEDCMKAYFNVIDEKESMARISLGDCKAVLDSKSSDESLANFAKWEPWHGRFGFYYPWEKYLQVGDLIRELASNILSMQQCLESPLQPSTPLRQAIKEPCKSVGLSLGVTLRELGRSISSMKRCQATVQIMPKLQSVKQELVLLSTSSRLKGIANAESLAMANLLFLLMEIVDKVEVLSKEVEALGEAAGFQSK
ncbi:hypothetical protein SSX86_022114 [Deinandra increscens subsp. villosa]|uniref:Aluminum-activated malate transporter n=1 Tax=Deinandra increscens subsp. villosa TaxID=3103831 RepID=A0AAP0CQ25_9ASTR